MRASIPLRTHLAEDNMLAIEPRGLCGAEEELRSVGPRPRIGHREDPLAGVLEREVLVLELFSVDGLACLRKKQISKIESTR